jgi:hypothetical protein
MTNLEVVKTYQIKWEDVSGGKGNWRSPVRMTDSELEEYLQHLDYDDEWFCKTYKTPEDRTSYRAELVPDEMYVSDKIQWDNEEDAEWAKLSEVVDDYIDFNIIDVFGFLDRSKVNFSMWPEIWEEHKDKLEEVVDIFDLVAVNEKCFLKTQGWFGKHTFYTDPIDKPTWFQVAMTAEIGIRSSGDTDHCFVEFIFKNGEIKDGLPVYEIHFGS